MVDETEEMLLNVNLVPFSKNIVLLLQHRILMPIAPSPW